MKHFRLLGGFGPLKPRISCPFKSLKRTRKSFYLIFKLSVFGFRKTQCRKQLLSPIRWTIPEKEVVDEIICAPSNPGIGLFLS